MNYDWEENKKDNEAKHTCIGCARTENHGALFKYHTHGVKSPYDKLPVKLPMYCTECIDATQRRANIPYYIVGNFIQAEQVFDFYVRKAEKVGGNIESANAQKQEVVRNYTILVDKSLQRLQAENLSMESFNNQCKEDVETFISWIAQVADVPRSSISNKDAVVLKKI